MKSRSILTILSFLILFHGVLQAAEFRTWTGSNGKTIEASFISFDNDTEIVHIRLKNGKDQRVKLSLFSQEDKDFVEGIGKTDNPFGVKEKESFKNGPTVRVSLFIDEFGKGTVRLEKAAEPPKDTFDGQDVKIAAFSKTKSGGRGCLDRKGA